MLTEEPILLAYAAVWLTLLGACVGSFADCAAWRIARGESLSAGRSHCDSCGATLGVRDLIPVVSYLAHRGKCRRCGAKIPAQCLWAEIAGAVTFLALGLRYGVGWETVMWLLCGSLLLVLSLIDWNTRLLPDKLLLAAAAVRVIFLFLLRQPLAQTVPQMLLGAVSISAPVLALSLGMDKLLGRESMGGGDIKLLFVLGLYLPWAHMLLLVLAACLMAIPAALWAKKRGKDEGIPFGPFLSAAWLLAAVAGDGILGWYLGLF
jgi:prepilin signal peptidase PulO-like enzyme (type II secretory pathway)